MIKEFIDMPRFERWVGRTFAFWSPNAWTTISLFIAIAAFFLVKEGAIAWGVGLFVFSAICDFIDGKVARHTRRDSKLGAFWDGTVDRFVDMLFILTFFFLNFPEGILPLPVLLFLLLFFTLLPPFIVAYANHRGAVPDPTEKVIWRFAFRVEYLIFFIAIIALNGRFPALTYYLLWASLILMAATVLQSIILVFIKAKNYQK